MSIATSLYADYANKVKKDWEKDLEEAIVTENWAMMRVVLAKMRKFYFSE